MRADATFGGSPCSDDSTMGKLKKRGGKVHKLYYLWIAWRRRLQEPAFIHENVCGLGDGEVQALLFRLVCDQDLEARSIRRRLGLHTLQAVHPRRLEDQYLPGARCGRGAFLLRGCTRSSTLTAPSGSSSSGLARSRGKNTCSHWPTCEKPNCFEQLIRNPVSDLSRAKPGSLEK